ncbi:BglG family transcription antiterminator [Lentibacillus sediminis]|uniref:BglG family transcription antiterminator n=1 Tax=Lentibacillus sediminis TaxID=1940529 RepID=UPI000C1BC0C7|nr:BglG family transcription antiterminator [Lentibacillus sediminis]
MLNTRMKTIMRELMASRSPLTGKYLAQLNKVTARTIREDVKSLNNLLDENGAVIDSVMGKGYQLEIKDDQRFRNYLQSLFRDETSVHSDVPALPKERIAYLIKRLLLSEEYIKLDDLADEIYVSKSTVQNDLRHVREALAVYDMEMESRPGYGLKVTGNELKLRFCMAEYLFNHKEETGNAFHQGYSLAFPQADLDAILAIIMKQIEEDHITLSDIAINNLLIHIAIAYKRIKIGHHVDFHHENMSNIVEQKEYEVAIKIVKAVEKCLQIEFPQPEVAYITIHLLGTKMLSQTSNGEKAVEQALEEDIYQLVIGLLKKIEEEYELGVSKDRELIIGLGLHLKPAINRYQYGMNVRNPMLEDIKKNYPLAFEAGILAGVALEEQTGVEFNENEIGYLALHIGAAIERKKLKSGPKRCLIVCASGQGTSQLIYYKLQNQFSREMEVVGATEYYKLDQYNLNDIDFIVSSIPIEGDLPVPVVEVNAILGEDDLTSVREVILDGDQDAKSLFQENLMFLKKDFNSKEEALEFMHHRLLEKELVDDTFLEAIYEREAVAATSFGNLVAIPHPITPKSDKTFLAVTTLNKPINWNDKPVQFICIISVKKNSTEDLQSLYKMLGNIIDNVTIVQKLIKAKTYEAFINILYNSRIT